MIGSICNRDKDLVHGPPFVNNRYCKISKQVVKHVLVVWLVHYVPRKDAQL